MFFPSYPFLTDWSCQRDTSPMYIYLCISTNICRLVYINPLKNALGPAKDCGDDHHMISTAEVLFSQPRLALGGSPGWRARHMLVNFVPLCRPPATWAVDPPLRDDPWPRCHNAAGLGATTPLRDRMSWRGGAEGDDRT